MVLVPPLMLAAEIYDVAADPGETANLYAQKPDALRPMLVERTLDELAKTLISADLIWPPFTFCSSCE